MEMGIQDQTGKKPAPQLSGLPPEASPSILETTASSAPDIFNYSDYRLYLRDWFQWKKSVSSGYSGAVFAKRAGLNSHTILGMVIRKDRNLSANSTRSFIRALGISGKEALYFEKLVLFNQSDKADDKEFYLEQLLSISKGQGQKLLTRIRNHAACLSRWYVVAIRELVGLEGFQNDPTWIVNKLKKKVTRKEVEEALRILEELELIAIDSETGVYRVIEPSIDLDPGVVDYAIRAFHKDFMKRAEDAIDNESVDERELSSLTLAVTDESLAKLRNRIKEFRKELNLEFTCQPGPVKPTHIVALNSQLLTLTESIERKGKTE